MKRILPILILLGIAAGALAVNPYLMVLARKNAGGGTVTINRTDTYQEGVGSGSPKTISTLSIGTASADRIVVVAMNYRSNVNVTDLTATIGGVSATVIGGAGTDATAIFQRFIIYAVVPTGTTADLVLTRGAGLGWNWIDLEVYALTGANAAAQDTGTANGATTLSDTLTTTSGGVVVCSATSNATGPSAAWSGGVTEDVDRNTSADNDTSTTAYGTASGASMTPQVVLSSASTQFCVAAFASFQPN